MGATRGKDNYIAKKYALQEGFLEYSCLEWTSHSEFSENS